MGPIPIGTLFMNTEESIFVIDGVDLTNTLSFETRREAILLRGVEKPLCVTHLPVLVDTEVTPSGDTVIVYLTNIAVLETTARAKITQVQKLDKHIPGKRKKLENKNFVDRAPSEVVKTEQESLVAMEAEREQYIHDLTDLIVIDWHRRNQMDTLLERMKAEDEAWEKEYGTL